MAIVFRYEFPGVTEEQYEGTVEAQVASGRMPDGCLVHVSGAMEGGWQVVDVWESKADCDRFHEDQLRHHMSNNAWEMVEPVSTWDAHTLFASQTFVHKLPVG